MMGKLIRRQRAMGLIPKWSNEAVKGAYGYVEPKNSYDLGSEK